MRLVPLPDGVLSGPGHADTFYQALSSERVEVAPVYFCGTGYLRIAAAPHNTPDDYHRLADTVRDLLTGGRTRFPGPVS
jgi:selenocysteine lyase/cysteine desulfurase